MPPTRVADGLTVMLPTKTKSSASAMNARAMVRAAAGPVTKTMTDTPPARPTYKMRMNQISTGAVGLGLDGQTKAYINVKGKDAKKVFASKSVPMTDGTDVLTSSNQKTISQRGYGNVVAKDPVAVPKKDRIGFNNTLVDTTGGKIAAYCAYTGKYPNHTVCSDFPKGPGGVTPNPMWEDGTYDEMMAAVNKKHTEGPVSFPAPKDRRREVFSLQALAGGEIYGDALLRTQMEGYMINQKLETYRELARKQIPGGTPEQIEELAQRIGRERAVADAARRLGVPHISTVAQEAGAASFNRDYDLLTQLAGLPRGANPRVVVERAAAEGEEERFLPEEVGAAPGFEAFARLDYAPGQAVRGAPIRVGRRSGAGRQAEDAAAAAMAMFGGGGGAAGGGVNPFERNA